MLYAFPSQPPDNVELRFALCNTDAQLEKTVGTFLPPVLLKLASPHEVVKKKVCSLLPMEHGRRWTGFLHEYIRTIFVGIPSATFDLAP